MKEIDVVQELIDIRDAYVNKDSLISNQGQAMDGFSALANFLALAEKVKRQKEDA